MKEFLSDVEKSRKISLVFSCFFDYFLGLDHLVGLDIAQNGVHISSSKPAGEAFVAFMNMDNALRALEFNRMNMGHRYGKLREREREKTNFHLNKLIK